MLEFSPTDLAMARQPSSKKKHNLNKTFNEIHVKHDTIEAGSLYI